MAETPIKSKHPTVAELEKMHELHRTLGGEREMAPHVVYSDSKCPYADCDRGMQAIDFRLEAHGKDVYDALVRAWWDDTGFAGRCPGCGRWIHFTIQSKLAITSEQADDIPRLPEDWFDEATVL